jgi:hypothetical protein
MPQAPEAGKAAAAVHMDDDDFNPCSIDDDDDDDADDADMESSPLLRSKPSSTEAAAPPRSLHGVHFGRRAPATAPAAAAAAEPEPEPEPEPAARPAAPAAARGFAFGRRASSNVAVNADTEATAPPPPAELPKFGGVTFGLVDPSRIAAEGAAAAPGGASTATTAGFSFGKSSAPSGLVPVPKAPSLPAGAELDRSTVDPRVVFGLKETASNNSSSPTFMRQAAQLQVDKAKRPPSRPGLGGFGFGGAATKLPPKGVTAVKTGSAPPSRVSAFTKREPTGSGAKRAGSETRPVATRPGPVSEPRPSPISKHSSSNKEDGAATDDEEELDKIEIRETSSKSSGGGTPGSRGTLGSGIAETQMSQMFDMMKMLTSTVGELKGEVEALKTEKNDAVAEAKFLSKQLSEGVRRTGELQRFLSAELEQYQDVRESLMEIKSVLMDVRASSTHLSGASRSAASSSSGSPTSRGSPPSSSPSVRFAPASPMSSSMSGLRAVALNQRRASNAGIAKASTFRPVSALRQGSSDSNGSGGATPTDQQASMAAGKAAAPQPAAPEQQAAAAKAARASRQKAQPAPAPAAPAPAAPAPAPAPAAPAVMTLQPVMAHPPAKSPDRTVATASRADHLSKEKPPQPMPMPKPAASPPRQRKKPLPTVDVESSPQSASLADSAASKMVPTPRNSDPIKVGHTYRACSRAVLRETSDPRSLAMSQYDPPRLDALAVGDTVTLKQVEVMPVKTKEGKVTNLFRVECELQGNSVGWTSIWAQNGKRLLDRVQKIKVIGLSGETVEVEVTASDPVGAIKEQAAPDASRALVVLDGEQVADDTKMSALPAGGQLRIVPRLGLKTPLRPPPSFHAQDDSMLTQLGEDLLEHVLRDLPSLQDKVAVTLSCRTLYSLRYVASLWKTLDFSTPEDVTLLRFERGAAVLPKAAEDWHDTDDKLFSKVAHVLGEGRHNAQYGLAHGIRLQHCPRITDNALRCMAATYPQLTTVGLRGCKAVTPSGIKVLVVELGGRCLERLDIGYCDAALVDESIGHISKHCTVLSSLVLRGGKRLDKASANLIGRWEGAAQLTELDLMGCLRLLSDVHLASILKPLAEKDSPCCSLNLSLRSADSNSRNPRDFHVSGASHLTDMILRRLSASCPALTSLQLADGARLSDDSMVQLLSQLKSLKSLDLHKCVKLKGTHIVQAIADHIPGVEELTLSEWRNNLGNKTMSLLASLQRLRKLDVHGNTCNHDGIAAVCEGCSSLKDFTMSCQPHAKLTPRLAEALTAASLTALTLIGVQQWWEEQPDDLVQALAPLAPAAGGVGVGVGGGGVGGGDGSKPALGGGAAGGRACALATVIHLDCDADTVQALSHKVNELVSAQADERRAGGGGGGGGGGLESPPGSMGVSSNLLPLNRSSHDELRGRLAVTRNGAAR